LSTNFGGPASSSVPETRKPLSRQATESFPYRSDGQEVTGLRGFFRVGQEILVAGFEGKKSHVAAAVHQFIHGSGRDREGSKNASCIASRRKGRIPLFFECGTRTARFTIARLPMPALQTAVRSGRPTKLPVGSTKGILIKSGETSFYRSNL